MSQSWNRPPMWKVWWVASRPHTLTASLAPAIVSYNAGMNLIDSVDKVQYLRFTVQWAIFCMLMQLGTNLHNDYADFVKGADNDKRVGQARATQKGWLTPVQTATAATTVLGLGLLLGMNFVFGIDRHQEGGWTRTILMALVVVTSVFNAFAYTGGPWPLGYIGLQHFSIGYYGWGDVFVFLYFGLVATLTLPFLYLSSTTRTLGSSLPDKELMNVLWAFLPYAVQVAVLATNIIVVNNLRDRHTDVEANKRTLAVRLGPTFCRIEFIVNIVLAFGLVLGDWITNAYSMWRLLPFLTLPMALKEIQAIHGKEGALLNPHVGGTAKVQFMFCILLSISLRLSS